jgi:crossover junction endodeoxyribonuclease RuvC
MIILGIDPGLTGAVAWSDGRDVLVHALPLSSHKRQIDPVALTSLIQEWRELNGISLAVVEGVTSRPGQGVVSVFTFGKTTGIILGVLGALHIPVVEPHPAVWKKRLFGGGTHPKSISVEYVRQRFPGLELRRTPRSRTLDDGLADAVCLAEWGRLACSSADLSL